MCFLLFTILLFSFIVNTIGPEVEIGPCLVQFLEPCSFDTIKFYIYTNNFTTYEPEPLSALEPHVADFIDLEKSTKLLVHGYAGNVDFNWTKQIQTGENFVFILIK